MMSHVDLILISCWSHIDFILILLISYWFHIDLILISCWSHWFHIDLMLISNDLILISLISYWSHIDFMLILSRLLSDIIIIFKLLHVGRLSARDALKETGNPEVLWACSRRRSHRTRRRHDVAQERKPEVPPQVKVFLHVKGSSRRTLPVFKNTDLWVMESFNALSSQSVRTSACSPSSSVLRSGVGRWEETGDVLTLPCFVHTESTTPKPRHETLNAPQGPVKSHAPSLTFILSRCRVSKKASPLPVSCHGLSLPL